MRIAALQMRSGTEPGPNLDALETLAAEAAGQGARYVLSPEMTVAFAENRDGLSLVAEPFEGNAALQRVGELARKLGVFVHLGSLAVALPDGRFLNRSVLFRPDGSMAAHYDKIHLFDATLNGVPAYRESATYAPGEVAALADVDGVRLGMSICYDVRFAVLYRALAAVGAQLIAVPAAFTVPTGEAHWEVLLRARAIETGCFVIAAAQGGRHANGRTTYGHSMIIDPWGTVLARKDDDEPGVIVADIDPVRVDEVRGQVPSLSNGRTFAVEPLDAPVPAAVGHP